MQQPITVRKVDQTNTHLDFNTGEHSASFRFSRFFINNSPQPITVVLRNNLPIKTTKMPSGYIQRRFAVRTVYHFNGKQSIINTINDIASATKYRNMEKKDLNIIYGLLVKGLENNKDISHISITIDKLIDSEQIKEQGCLYYPELDLLIYEGDYNPKIAHPKSEEGKTLEALNGIVNERKISGVLVEIVDNEFNIRKRYMYAANHLIEINAKKDGSRASGIYFTTADHDRLGDIHIEPKHYTFEEAEEKLGIHRTKEEAITAGNPELLLKAKSQEREAELLASKANVELLRNELKMEEMKRTEEIAKIKHEQEKILNELKARIHELEADAVERRRNYDLLKEKYEKKKAKRERRKAKEDDHRDSQKQKRSDYYEEESMNRKATQEWVKFIPAMLTGIFALVTLFAKSK